MDLNQAANKRKEKFIIGGGIVLIIIVLAVVFWLRGSAPASPGGAQKITPQGYVANNPNALPTVQGGTREKVVTNIATPGENATSVPKNVAVPTVATQTGNISFRHFDIKGDGNAFVPNTIVVNAGDVIDLAFTAVDQDYNIYFPDFGVNMKAAKGQTVKPQFQAANYGQYQFVCNICSGQVTGRLIVNQK